MLAILLVLGRHAVATHTATAHARHTTAHAAHTCGLTVRGQVAVHQLVRVDAVPARLLHGHLLGAAVLAALGREALHRGVTVQGFVPLGQSLVFGLLNLPQPALHGLRRRGRSRCTLLPFGRLSAGFDRLRRVRGHLRLTCGGHVVVAVRPHRGSRYRCHWWPVAFGLRGNLRRLPLEKRVADARHSEQDHATDNEQRFVVQAANPLPSFWCRQIVGRAVAIRSHIRIVVHVRVVVMLAVVMHFRILKRQVGVLVVVFVVRAHCAPPRTVNGAPGRSWPLEPRG